MKWEYWKAELPTREKETIPYLDKFGSEGWELVSVDNGIAYFKRPLRNLELEARLEVARAKALGVRI